jgi:nitrite reductase/ring-hydroxylating ferredoxin subunit
MSMALVTVYSEEQLRKDGRALVEVNGSKIALFFNGERFFAVRNTCPHTGAPLYWGNVTGTLMPGKPGEYIYGMEGLILECPWHKREFSLETGCTLTDERLRVRTYPLSIEAGQVRIEIG